MISSGFFAIEDNLLSLEISSLDIIADLTLTHKELQTPAWHLMEKAKKYKKLSESLDSAIKLENLRALSDTLIRQKS